MSETRIPELECVDATVGGRILELTRPGLDPDTRQLLEAHLSVCAHCRQAVDLDQRLAAAFPTVRRRGLLRTRSRWVQGAALAAAAAAAFCMVALPPRPFGPELSLRGANDARFVRPVEGEVVRDGSLSIRWTAVPNADSYEVRLSEVDGTLAWTGSTTDTTWHPGPEVELVDGRSYRLVLSTIPADLLALGATSVRFTAGGTPQVITHRIKRAQPVAYGLIGLAMLLGIIAIGGKRKA